MFGSEFETLAPKICIFGMSHAFMFAEANPTLCMLAEMLAGSSNDYTVLDLQH